MSLTGDSNEVKIWNYLKDKIGNDYGVAGLMGNLFAESGLSPINLQNTYNKSLGMTDDQYTMSVDNGDYTNFVKDKAGYGLAQWTYWSRKQNLLDFCHSRKSSIGDLEMQLDFLWHELENCYMGVLETLKSASSVRQASDAVLLKFERPADQSESVQIKRSTFGHNYYSKYHKEMEVNKMSNSSLVEVTNLSPNHSGKRTHAVDTITPHCFVGQVTAERGLEVFLPKTKGASCNYVIGTDGKLGLGVDEDNRSWCSSSESNDQRAITIECASDTAHPYAMTDAVYGKLVALCVDICKRYGKTKLIWIADKDKALAYEPKSDEMKITVHRWFKNKACPGDWLFNRLGELAETVTSQLTVKEPQEDGVLYRVQVGAYSNKENADAQLVSIKNAGFDAFVTMVDGLYKVQVGAFSVKANAEAMLANVKAKGFDAFITTNAGSAVPSTPNTPTPSAPAKKTDAEIAKEIYAGTCSDSRWSSWGTGETRKQRLKEAGYDPSKVQAEVNKLFK